MNNKKPTRQLMVSKPQSGLGIYLPEEVRDHLGGLGTAVRVECTEMQIGGWLFRIHPDKRGVLFVRKHGEIKVTHSSRIFWNLQIPQPLDFKFGAIDLEWEYQGDGITFILPPKSQLPPPMTKTRKVEKIPLLKGMAKYKVTG